MTRVASLMDFRWISGAFKMYLRYTLGASQIDSRFISGESQMHFRWISDASSKVNEQSDSVGQIDCGDEPLLN